ncbi:MAG: protein-glutamate O-methyltransferase CheR [Deltaproteobacteria bacterium]|nr:protein-glutamate O-methyltransferase CheR [Deltaproteobacteria bacterium]
MRAEIVAQVGRRLAEHAGLELPAWVLASRIESRVAARGVLPERYVELLDGDGEVELRALVEAVRVGETRFFRHRTQVQALVDVVVPAWRLSGRRTLRVWSAGCATGEEPYTLALVLARLVPRQAGVVSILATDVSDEALAFARRATYPAGALEHIAPEWQGGVVVEGDRVRVRPEVAGLVSFERHNLADDDDRSNPARRGFDVVWCRNVLIYFGAAIRARVVERLVDATLPGGFVFVGYSESLRDVANLEALRVDDAVIYRRPGGPAITTRDTPRESARDPRDAKDPSGERAIVRDTTRPSGERAIVRAPTRPSGERAIAVPRTDRPSDRIAARPTPVAAVIRPRPVTPSPSAGHEVGTFALVGHCDDPKRVADDLSRALARPRLAKLVVQLDAAEFLADELAPVLRRAKAAAAAAAVALEFAAVRPGAQRWLRRHGFEPTGGAR